MNPRSLYIIGTLLLMAAMVYTCRPERTYRDDPDTKLVFTTDTVYFDTVFTTVGTVTRSFRVKNPYNRFVKIEDILLAGGESSVFRVNVDGQPGTQFRNYEIAPGDSMYVFVEATLDPNNDPNILRVQDSVVFLTNGNTQDVDLVAWGQDVHMKRGEVIEEPTTWVADKPYLVIDSLVVDTLQRLTIEEGATLYMHSNAFIKVEGTLEIAGSLDAPVEIRGDRLEMMYDDIPGQWGFIYFAPGSVSNRIEHARIVNGVIGLWADSLVVSSPDPVLSIANTEINQMSYDGILARGTSVEAHNLVVGDCGNSCMELLYEGSYEFTHCTFANFWRQGFSSRRAPALLIANYFVYEDASGAEQVEVRDITNASFRNCIIYGDRLHELDVLRHPDGELNYSFAHCLTRIDQDELPYATDPNFDFIVNNVDPLFDSLRVSYELDTLSPALDQGLLEAAVEFPFDKKGDSRLDDGEPDLGAFERIEE